MRYLFEKSHVFAFRYFDCFAVHTVFGIKFQETGSSIVNGSYASVVLVTNGEAPVLVEYVLHFGKNALFSDLCTYQIIRRFYLMGIPNRHRNRRNNYKTLTEETRRYLTS